MAKTLYYNAVTEEMEFVNNPSPLRENLGERFGLNEGGRINMKIQLQNTFIVKIKELRPNEIKKIF